jgi:maltose O-acetyltransferase
MRAKVRIFLRNYRRDVLINGLAMSGFIPLPFRNAILRVLGLDIGPRATLLAGTWFGSTRVRVGLGSFIGRGCYLDALEWITIGERCDLGAEVALITSSHEIAEPTRRAGKSIRKPITIGDGAWIGARAMIMPGVAVGAGAVIAAGSLVTRDCEPNSLYVGSPARLVRSLGEGQADQAASSEAIA